MKLILLAALLIVAASLAESEEGCRTECADTDDCPVNHACKEGCCRKITPGNFGKKKGVSADGVANEFLKYGECKGQEDTICKGENGNCMGKCKGIFSESPTGKCTVRNCKCCLGCKGTEDDTCKGEKGNCNKKCNPKMFTESSSGKCTNPNCKCCLKNGCKGSEDAACKGENGTCGKNCKDGLSQSSTGSCSNSKCKCCVTKESTTRNTTMSASTTAATTTTSAITSSTTPTTTSSTTPTTTSSTTQSTTSSTTRTTTSSTTATTTASTTATTTSHTTAAGLKMQAVNAVVAKQMRIRKALDTALDISADAAELKGQDTKKRIKRSLTEFNRILHLLKLMQDAFEETSDLKPLEEELRKKRVFLAELKKDQKNDPPADDEKDEISKIIQNEVGSTVLAANAKLRQLDDEIYKLISDSGK